MTNDVSIKHLYMYEELGMSGFVACRSRMPDFYSQCQNLGLQSVGSLTEGTSQRMNGI